MTPPPPTFPYSRLEVYQAATTFVASVDYVAAALPRGRGYLVNQLRRAALSIQANIAEGAGEFRPPEKVRFTGWRCGRRPNVGRYSTAVVD